MDEREKLILKALLAFIVTAHWVIIVGNTLAFFLLPFFAPWYVAMPVMSYIGLLTFSKVLDCPITKLENRIRKRIRMPEIKGFIGHYMIKPIKRAKIRKRLNKPEEYDSYGMYR